MEDNLRMRAARVVAKIVQNGVISWDLGPPRTSFESWKGVGGLLGRGWGFWTELDHYFVNSFLAS